MKRPYSYGVCSAALSEKIAMFRLTVLVLASAFILTGPTKAQSRLPDIPPAQYDADQKKAAEEFQAARKAPLSGPFQTMMYSPEVMSRARAMGDYLRFHSVIRITSSLSVLPIAELKRR